MGRNQIHDSMYPFVSIRDGSVSIDRTFFLLSEVVSFERNGVWVTGL